MTLPPDDLAAIAVDALLALPEGRKLIAVAGPPGAGKSTVADAIARALQQAGRTVCVVPMDGFHLDNAVLDETGLRARKGALATFDAGGFAHLVARIARGETNVAYPVFDRSRDIAIAGAARVPEAVEFIMFEGNYLLLNDAPWDGLAAHWSFTIWAGADIESLTERLMRRWLDAGLSREAALAKLEQNDLPNARHVIAQSRAADLDLSVMAGSG